ncbi:MAG: hypothetical protein KDB00_09095 [Planctomycetales bacterium]|nr:hypothetical protein [Planctomycetales bacterium]MCA9160292.1 hypothetical protein [Planctomycetales bacterium]
MKDVQDQADRALAAIKSQAAEAGVSQNAHIFENAAKAESGVAIAWLISTSVAAIVTLGITIYFASRPAQSDSMPSAVQVIFSRVLVVSVSFFVLVLCSKNYRASKHNQTLNQHRANALKTFKAFVEGSEEQTVRDAVLLHAAQAAFSPRSTGFDGSDSDGQQIQPVVEVIGKALPAIARSQSS